MHVHPVSAAAKVDAPTALALVPVDNPAGPAGYGTRLRVTARIASGGSHGPHPAPARGCVPRFCVRAGLAASGLGFRAGLVARRCWLDLLGLKI